MKPLKLRTVFTIFLAVIPAILVALIWMRARERHNASYIQGIVVDETPDLSEKSLTQLEMATSEKEFLQILEGMRKGPIPVPNAVVTAKSDLVTKKANTDSKGKFRLIGLPSGDYEVLAEVSSGASTAGKRRMATFKPVKVYLRGSTLTASVQVTVRSDLVAIRGRIMDVEGRPIVGAKVSGEPFPMPESAEATPPTRFAVSGADGSYELSGFRPDGIYRIAGYLGGGDPTEFGQNPFYVKVYVEADGFEQDKTKIPKIPLATEELLEPARRFLKIMRKLDPSPERSSKFVEKKDVFLPPSEKNAITGIDIVLTKQAAVR